MENEIKSILITGGSGLVGNAIKKVSNDYNKYKFIFVSSKDYDLTKFEDTQKMFEDHHPNYVIHLAAYVGGLYKNMNNKVDMFEKNLMINYNVIKCSHDYKVEKLISCLSTCIFPDKTTYPIREHMLHDGPPHDSNYAYAHAKRMIELHSRAYRENYGDNFICITPCNIYGPYDNFSLEDGHVLPALIHKCYLAKKNNEDFVIRGTGKPLRQFIYSYDLAKIIMILFDNQYSLSDFDINKDNIIISSPEESEISIGDIARIIANKYNYKNRMIFDQKYSDGQYKKTVSIDKLYNIIGDFNYTSIEVGINNTIDWFIENIDNSKR
jgi:GDP-L-fucose synthase